MIKICVKCYQKYLTSSNRQKYCTNCYASHYRMTHKNSSRYSGKYYENSKERLEEIKEKYKNGIPKGIIEQMVGVYE